MLIEHLERIREGAKDVYNLGNLGAWIEKNIYLEGRLMSLSGAYSFQKDIVNNTARVVNVSKCAQIGLSTCTMAYFLAGLATQRRFNTIYALPTASDAAKLTATKLNPLIYGSPRLRELIDKNVDSIDLKQFGENFLFTRGSKSETAALSISADLLVVDEVDRCDIDVLKQFRSRLQASPLALIRQFSTPTLAGVGISREAEASKRYRHMASCAHCGHSWVPTYDLDIVVPGYGGPLVELTRHNIKDVAWQGARWNCPSCGKDPVLAPERLEWVCENPGENYEADTYFVTPVTACAVLAPSYLVRTSTEFASKSEWRNQVLGEPSEDGDEQIIATDVDAVMSGGLDSSEVHYLGADMGLLCNIAIGRVTTAGELLVVHREVVPIGQFMERRSELIARYRVVVSVHDAFPYTSEVMRITDYDPNAYGCSFPSSKSPELFTIAEKTEDAEEGRLNLRLVKANRTRLLDELMGLFKRRELLVARVSDSMDSLFMTHVLSLKRTQLFVQDELRYVWQKTDGEDHSMFALGYLYLACKLRGTVNGHFMGFSGIISKFRVK